eukprot:TRINITY_DN63874_c0_g1_i1.p1 TRINITY_DN63874_c0_g1~~TRINITY_DN63874_c0_g1_i1.p1  ORF type:complete len:425 (-),score=50.35 TRINITY_DN63874_c0_g1_i1:112-1386(-)
MDAFNRDISDAILACLVDWSALQDLNLQTLSRYPRTSSCSGHVHRERLQGLPIFNARSPSECVRLAGFVESLVYVEALCKVSKSWLRRILPGVRETALRRPSRLLPACFVLARSDTPLLLSQFLEVLPVDKMLTAYLNHPYPDRYGGSALRDEAEGTIMHAAVASSTEQTLRLLVTVCKKHGLDVDATDSIVETPLCLAVKTGHLGCASTLLRAAADVNEMAGTAYPRKLGKELDTDYFNCITPLSVAAFLHDASMARLLLDFRADVNGENDVEVMQSPMMACVFSASQADCVNVTATTNVLRVLLEHKADVNGRPSGLDPKTLFRTTTFVAAYNQWTEILELLLRHNADPNAPDEYEDRPLHAALKSHSCEAAQLLLNFGATMDRKAEFMLRKCHFKLKLHDCDDDEFILGDDDGASSAESVV